MATYHEEAGKGSFKRPRDVSKEQYESNWDRIFGKKELSKEDKLEVFNKNKVENFKASTLLEKPFCTTCGNTQKVFDGGWEYDCQVCE